MAEVSQHVASAVYAQPVGNGWAGTTPANALPSAYLGDWPYADDGSRGLPDWVFNPPADLVFYYVELYSNGNAEWTGGMGVVWRRPGGAHLTRQQLGQECDSWCRDNL